MKFGRISIAGLIGFISLIAVGLAGLHSASEIWARSFFSLAMFAALTATLGTIFATGPVRAFSAGFAIFSALYLWFTVDVAGEPTVVVNGVLVQKEGHPLISENLLDALLSLNARNRKLRPGDKVKVSWNTSYFPSTVLETNGDQTKIHYDNYQANFDEWVSPMRIAGGIQSREYFLRVGHSLFAMILGCVGGIIAQAFQATRREGIRRGPGYGPRITP